MVVLTKIERRAAAIEMVGTNRKMQAFFSKLFFVSHEAFVFLRHSLTKVTFNLDDFFSLFLIVKKDGIETT